MLGRRVVSMKLLSYNVRGLGGYDKKMRSEGWLWTSILMFYVSKS